jgi:hypothetical protein
MSALCRLATYAPKPKLLFTAVALASNPPVNGLVCGYSDLNGGHNGGPSTMEIIRAKMCAFRAASQVCSREASIAETCPDMV